MGDTIYFQDPGLLYDEVLAKIREGFLLFSKMLLKKGYQGLEFDDLYKIDFNNLNNLNNLEKVSDFDEFKANINQRYPTLEALIKEVLEMKPKRQSIIKECYMHAQQFIKRVIISMKSRLPFEENILLKSQAIFLKEKTFQAEAWRELAFNFPNIITRDKEVQFSEELDIFELNYKAIYLMHINSEISIIKRWEMLSKNYGCLSSLAKSLLVLPYSSAPVESIFSNFKAFKTPYRNQLSVESLESSILSEQMSLMDQSSLLPQMIEKYFQLWEKKPQIQDNNSKHQHLPENLLENRNEERLDDSIQPKQALDGILSANVILESLISPFLMKVVSQISQHTTVENLIKPILIKLASDVNMAEPQVANLMNLTNSEEKTEIKEGTSKRKAEINLQPDQLKQLKFNKATGSK